MRENVSRDTKEVHVDRAGVFIHTPALVLLVQSYDWKWGPPKGRIETGETALECAVRETYEETGLNVSADIDVSRCTTFKGKWSMYDVKFSRPEFMFPLCSEITGIGWFSVSCIRKNKHVINHPAKLCMQEFMGVGM